jgi:hypothetical protein
MKIPSSLINVYGAHLQNVLDDAPDGIDDPAIFSSWLGPLVTGTIRDGGIEGSFEEHVSAAVCNIYHHHIHRTEFSHETVLFWDQGGTVYPNTLGYTIVLRQEAYTLDTRMRRFWKMRADYL